MVDDKSDEASDEASNEASDEASDESVEVSVSTKATSTEAIVTEAPVTESSTTESSTTEASTTTTKKTSTPFACTADGIYANPDNCSTFYICSNGTPYLFVIRLNAVLNNLVLITPCINSILFSQNCPATIVFNPTIGTCDWISNVPSCSTSV